MPSGQIKENFTKFGFIPDFLPGFHKKPPRASLCRKPGRFFVFCGSEHAMAVPKADHFGKAVRRRLNSACFSILLC